MFLDPTDFIHVFEALALLFVALLTYLLFVKRDLRNLTSYLSELKDKMTGMNKKIKTLEMEQLSNPVQILLMETLEYIRQEYELKYGHEIGQASSQITDERDEQHFLYIMTYQGMKAMLSALENSRTPEQTWEKIAAQMQVLIAQFTAIHLPSAQAQISQQSAGLPEQRVMDNADSGSPSSAEEDDVTHSQEDIERDIFIRERKDEIARLKSQVARQFEEIWQLQSKISEQMANCNEPQVVTMKEGLDSITRQLKDAQLCIHMMEADIATSDEEIAKLKEQLQQLRQPAPSHQKLLNEIREKDRLIERLTQESKEMMTLIDGMEQNAREQSEQIKKLQAQL